MMLSDKTVIKEYQLVSYERLRCSHDLAQIHIRLMMYLGLVARSPQVTKNAQYMLHLRHHLKFVHLCRSGTSCDICSSCNRSIATQVKLSSITLSGAPTGSTQLSSPIGLFICEWCSGRFPLALACPPPCHAQGRHMALSLLPQRRLLPVLHRDRSCYPRYL